MSTREYAVSIFNRLTEIQLEKFIELFAKPESNETSMAFAQEEDIEKKTKNFFDLEASIIPIPDLDERTEKDEYFKEKYGL